MEDTQAHEGRKFMSILRFEHTGATSIEESKAEVERTIACARENGLRLVDGDTHAMREREPIETLSWGSDEPLRNMKAEEERAALEQGTPAAATA